MAPVLDPMVGRYVRLDIDGTPHRLYFEEAGQGIPLVCLHTAGADGRQFRHLLADPEITNRFRVIAFDMPWHGKSTPPDGWEKTEYRLTTASYTAAIRAFVSSALRNSSTRIVPETRPLHGAAPVARSESSMPSTASISVTGAERNMGSATRAASRSCASKRPMSTGSSSTVS